MDVSENFNNLKYKKLKKLYINKCDQLEKADLSGNKFRYQVLKAEAEVLKAELELDSS